MDIFNLIIVFLVGIGASIYGTIIGGSILITIPLLILMGLPPHTALGTDRVGIIGLNISGWYKFNQKKLINYRVGFSMAIPAFAGSFLGANLVLQINEAVLKLIIAGLTVLMLIFMILSPDIGIARIKRTVKKQDYYWGALMTFCVGIYSGFYGASDRLGNVWIRRLFILIILIMIVKLII